MLAIDFGIRIKQLRGNSKLSQVELSKKSGIGREMISKIESGQINVTLETIEKLSNSLVVSPAELFTFKKRENNLKPFVKWAGGKTQLLDEIKSRMPKKYNRY